MVDTVTASYIRETTAVAGWTASIAEVRKHIRYSVLKRLKRQYTFVPVPSTERRLAYLLV